MSAADDKRIAGELATLTKPPAEPFGVAPSAPTPVTKAAPLEPVDAFEPTPETLPTGVLADPFYDRFRG